MKIHDIFHINLLSPYKAMEAYGESYTHPSLIIEDGEEQYEINTILDMRRYGRRKTLQYLVHWKGYPHTDDSWLNHKDLNAPDLLKEFYQSSTINKSSDVQYKYTPDLLVNHISSFSIPCH
jgi:hypothetical protein